MKKHGQIELYQLFFLLVHVQIGVSVVTLPYDLFLVADGDGWITILIAGVVIQIFILLFGIVIKRYPNDHLFQIAEKVFGKGPGKVISFLYVSYFIYLAIFILNKYSLIISAWMMPFTPNWVLISLIIFISVYIITAELPIIARFIVLSSLIFIVYIIFGLYALKNMDITYILPIGDAGTEKIIKGVFPAILAFNGFGTLIIFAPFINGTPRQITKVASISNAFVTLFYLFIVIVSLLVLSPSEIVLVPEPVLYLVKSFTFKVIERPDLLFTAIWVVLVVTSYALFIYVASVGMQQTFNMRQRKIAVYISAVISFLISISFKGTYTLITFTDMDQKISFIFSFVFPLMAVMYIVVFGKRSEESE